MIASRRLLLVFGTRPEAIKLVPVAHAILQRPDIDMRCCVTGQHDAAMLDPILSLAGLIPDIRLSVGQPGQSLDRLTVRLIESVGTVLDDFAPDRVIVQGDTTTAMATAITAASPSAMSRPGCDRAISTSPGPRKAIAASSRNWRTGIGLRPRPRRQRSSTTASIP